MLLEFSVENFRSIKDKISFSMIAGSEEAHQDYCYELNNNKVLGISVIYGNNSSGKTNLLEAIRYLSYLINMNRFVQDSDNITRFPHKLSYSKPTVIDIKFAYKNIIYSYGISVKDDCFEKEYLYTDEEKIFERRMDEISYGDMVKNDLIGIENKMKKNKLFLSIAEAWSNNNYIISANTFLTKSFIFTDRELNNWLSYAANTIKNDENIKKVMITFFNRIGVNIKDIDVNIETNKIIDENLPIKFVKEAIQEKIEVNFIYEEYSLNLKNESEGTKKIFKLLCPLLDIIKNGKILIADELERSLHPTILKELLRLIMSNGNKGAQLIFTSHDTTLLDLDFMRKDQIWFAEKNPTTLSSEYFSLVEFRDIRQNEDIRVGYLRGRYSDIPIKGASIYSVVEGNFNA